MRALIAALLVLGGVRKAHAAACQFSGVTGVAFGQYDPFAQGPVDTLGAIRLTCTDVQASDLAAVELSRGSSSTFFPRTLRSGNELLSYNIFVDSGRTAVWGDGLSGTARYGPFLPPSGATVEIPVFGRVPGGQNAAAGVYADSVVVTLVF